MRDLTNGQITPDNEVIFYDGFLYIISRIKDGYWSEKEFVEDEYAIDVITLTLPYTRPITLAEISEKYPKVQKLIFDDAMRGYVYSYGNHAYDKNEKNIEMWELVGTTVGYA